MKSLLKYAAFALVAGILLCGFDAAATDTDVWGKTFSTVANIFKNVRVVVYVIGAFGLIGVAVGFIFGKLQLKWLAFLAIGLAIVAAADMIVNYATKAKTGGVEDASSQWSDGGMIE